MVACCIILGILVYLLICCLAGRFLKKKNEVPRGLAKDQGSGL